MLTPEERARVIEIAKGQAALAHVSPSTAAYDALRGLWMRERIPAAWTEGRDLFEATMVEALKDLLGGAQPRKVTRALNADTFECNDGTLFRLHEVMPNHFEWRELPEIPQPASKEPPSAVREEPTDVTHA